MFDDFFLQWLFPVTLVVIPPPTKHSIEEWVACFKEATIKQDNEMIRRMVRRGIPDTLRGWAWARLLEIDNVPFKVIQEDYQKAFNDVFGAGFEPHDIVLHSHSHSDAAINRIMSIVSHQNPLLDSTSHEMIMQVLSILTDYFEGEEMLLVAAKKLINMDVARRKSGDDFGMFPGRNASLMLQLLSTLLKRESPALTSHLSLVDKSATFRSLLFGMMANVYKETRIPCRLFECWLVEGFKVSVRFVVAHIILKKDALLFIPLNDQTSLTSSLMAPIEHPELLPKTAFSFHFSRKMLKSSRYSCDAIPRDCESLCYHNNTLPRLMHKSQCIRMYSEWQALWHWLPPRHQGSIGELVFASYEHGQSLQHLFLRCALREPLIILIDCIDDYLMGAFLSKSFVCRRGGGGGGGGTALHGSNNKNIPYGTGETFVFGLRPEALKCSWKPDPDNHGFIVANEKDGIGVGVGEQGFALHVDKTLSQLSSAKSCVFNNDPFFTGIKVIEKIEIWSFGNGF